MSEVVEQAGEPRLARLEGVRAVAALGVLVGHALIFGRLAEGRTPVDGRLDEVLVAGGLGVFLFFALTGYLMYRPFAAAHFGGGRPIDLRRFARNRALRILPIYYVVLVVVLVLQEDGGTREQWFRFVLFLQNFSSETVGTVDGPMWSLVVELHFYVLLPLLALGLARVAGQRALVAAAVLLVLGVASLYLHWVKVEDVAPAAPDLRWGYSLPANFGFFVAGMLLALAKVRLDAAPGARWAAGPLGHGDLWLLASVPLWLAAAFDLRLLALCAPAAALVVGGCVVAPRHGPVVRALAFRPLVLVGLVSYGLYLIHFPLMQALADDAEGFGALLLVGGAAALALAAAGYVAVERPFLRLRRRWA